MDVTLGVQGGEEANAPAMDFSTYEQIFLAPLGGGGGEAATEMKRGK
jgi:hypothetical protein